MRRLLPLIPLTLLLAACGGSNGGGGGDNSSALQTIQISEKEYSLNPSSITVPKAGTYAFEVTNDGQTTHALEVEESGGANEEETGDIEPGAKKTIEFTFSAGGSYEMYCPVDGHRQQGMEGAIMVGGAAGGGRTTSEDGMTTTDEDNGGRGY
jgi:plastocyanin